jgi:uncharacterized membrane protein SpoIIM required for sporulation
MMSIFNKIVNYIEREPVKAATISTAISSILLIAEGLIFRHYKPESIQFQNTHNIGTALLAIAGPILLGCFVSLMTDSEENPQ